MGEGWLTAAKYRATRGATAQRAEANGRTLLERCRPTSRNTSLAWIDRFFFSSRRRHTRLQGDWSSDVCSSDLQRPVGDRQSQIRIWGFLGAPGVSRATRQDQHLFVNRRPIDNRALNYALLEGYHTALMKGRYPVCCLFLELDPAGEDVNIHPSKRDAKFHQDKAVRR